MKWILLILLILGSMTIYGQERILSKNRTYVYLAIYRDSINNILLQDTIRFLTTKKIKKYLFSANQTIVYWKYTNLITDSLLKTKIHNFTWGKIEKSGAIEDEIGYWIHPPRYNQYWITEIAPFPSVNLPCEKNKKYQSILGIGKDCQEWSNLIIKWNYEIVDKVTMKIGLNNYECWVIRSESESNLGKSFLVTIFNEKIGFVEFHYNFYNKTKIDIELVRIE